MNILEIAAICHEANRMLCLAAGDTSQPQWMHAPTWQRESAVHGVEEIAAGRITRADQSHESWMAQKLADGWVYGEVKDAEAKTHPCLVPYEQLSEHDRAKDDLFYAIATTMLYRAGLLAPHAGNDDNPPIVGAHPMIGGALRTYPTSAATSSDLANRFTYHSPKADQLPRYAKLRNTARGLAQEIVELTPYSREQSLALTKLEESIFFANAAIARNEK